jgi:hypothetical protein
MVTAIIENPMAFGGFECGCVAIFDVRSLLSAAACAHRVAVDWLKSNLALIAIKIESRTCAELFFLGAAADDKRQSKEK